jgi:penicillin-binding protein-related factor A (putative recombinase)
MKEAQFQTLWGKYLQEHKLFENSAFELKLCKTGRFPILSIKEHQIKGLKGAKTGLYHKLTDFPMFTGSKTRFNRPKPFDCLWIKGSAYLCVLFYTPRKPKRVIMVDIDDFLKAVKKHPMKSFTADELKEYGKEIIL